ncbi:hypothetical protein PSEHALCIP103_03382 [Pseudoalteromonas haloplanktis]|uniref:NodB homology domain-containing protein n=1 Tax=Pseudoalteromonas haloplanktis TaxID=228 RepID=A0A9W4W2W9_PSEHA|nr:hypothetical protein [Pseudoalteromonas haloplanktis]CAH9065453.1 hypothetical protein PSEHALCIP103_03382 [Pseudoalteromonas haloplanktis]
MFILTFDYELFGSGNGCVFKHIIHPTNSILATLKKLEIKATFFVEQLEVDALVKLKQTSAANSDDYKAAIALEQQLCDIISSGHDIQLHLHPQWYQAIKVNNNWQLNFDWWRFSALPFRTRPDGTPGKFDLIKAGKASLESRFRKFKPDYVCHSFRAGGYNIGDDAETIKALLENDILLDSSVCPGFYVNSELSQFDFTLAEKKLPFWRSDESLLNPSIDSGIAYSRQCVELPLVSIKSSNIEKLSLARVYTLIKNKRFKSVSYAGGKSTDLPKEIDNFTNSNFDVCLSSTKQIEKFYDEINQITKNQQSLYPITLIGHPKDYSFFSPMKKIITDLSKKGTFITIDEFVKEINK